MEAIMPNLTFVYQLIIFFAALAVVKYFILNPLSEVLSGRDERIAGAEKEASRLGEESESLDETYREKIRDARAQSKLERGQQREKAQAEEKDILGKGRDAAKVKLQAIAGEIQKESDAARAQLKEDAAQISRMFAEKLLGRPVS
jgi:F-type H+-transporting ATPase subunit b